MKMADDKCNKPSLLESRTDKVNEKKASIVTSETRQNIAEIMAWFDDFLKNQGVSENGISVVKEYINEINPILPTLLYNEKDNQDIESFYKEKIEPEIIDYYADNLSNKPGEKLIDYWISKMLDSDSKQRNSDDYIQIIFRELKYYKNNGEIENFYDGNLKELEKKLFVSYKKYLPLELISELDFFVTIFDKPELIINEINEIIYNLTSEKIEELFKFINKRIESPKDQSDYFNSIFMHVIESIERINKNLKSLEETSEESLKEYLKNGGNINERKDDNHRNWKEQSEKREKYGNVVKYLIKCLPYCNGKLSKNVFLELREPDYGWINEGLISNIDKFEGLDDKDYEELWLSYYNSKYSSRNGGYYAETDIENIFKNFSTMNENDIDLFVSLIKHTSIGKEKKQLITKVILQKIAKNGGSYCEILNKHYKGYFDEVVVNGKRLADYIENLGFSGTNISNMLDDISPNIVRSKGVDLLN